MGIFTPFLIAGRTFNAVSNVYTALLAGSWLYKTVRKMKKEKLKASELRLKFIEEFEKEFERSPTEEEISVALRGYNAVERPIQKRIYKIIGKDK